MKINIRFIKKIGVIIYWLIIVFIVFIGLLTLISATSMSNRLHIYSVSTGSMEPAIPTGSAIFVLSSDKYNVGEIISFKSVSDMRNPNPQSTTTHRVYSVEEADGMTFYTTKGDANSVPDEDKINGERVIGRSLFHIPFLGYLVSFTRTAKGLILLIIIPSVLIIYDELLKIKNMIIKLYREKHAQHLY